MFSAATPASRSPAPADVGPTGYLGRFRMSLASVRALALMIAGLLSPMTAEATIVVGLHGDDQLIIGTDSKVTAPRE